MADYTNRGSLWKNTYKEKGDNKPHYTGVINIDGVEKRLAAWLEDQPNSKVLSLEVSEKRPKQDSSEAYRDAAQPSRPADPARQEPQRMATDDDDLGPEVPF